MFRFRYRFILSAASAALILLTGSCASTSAAAGKQSAAGNSSSLQVAGVNYVEVQAFFSRFGLKGSWIVRGRSVRLKSEWTTIEIENDKRDVQLNGIRVLMGEPAVADKGSIYISTIDAEKLFTPILSPSSVASPAAPALRVIAIDAGHGGQDTGTQNKALGLNEKAFTLDVANRLRALLAKQGYQVVMTRTNDSFIELSRRAEIANKAGADLFISIHFNAVAGAPNVRGAEVYTMTPQYQRSTGNSKRDRSDNVSNLGNANDPWNALLGYYIHREVVQKVGSEDRGLKRARFAVLRLVKSPAVLVEAGYLSNNAEARRIATPAYRASLAEAIAAGVSDYARAISTAKSR